MQLCIDARMISSSGIGTFLKNLIPHFSSLTTTLLVHAEDLEKEPWLRNYPFCLCRSKIYSIAEQIEIPKLVPTCAIFWSPHYNVPILPIRAKKRVVTLHDAAHLYFGKSLGWKKQLYANLLFKQAVSRSDLVISDSSFSKEELIKYLCVSTEKIQVVHLGVDVKRFSEASESKVQENLRKKYDLPSSFFLFIGNVKPHKNLKLLIDVYEQFGFPIPLVVVGKMQNLLEPDPLIEKIQKEPLLKKQIHLIGEILDTEVPHFYKMATALIFPSFYEGFGLPPLEAMASDCPVIASNRASIPEICADAAYLIDPENPKELLQAMREVTQNLDLREHLKKLGKERVLRFSWNKTAEHYTNLLYNLSRS